MRHGLFPPNNESIIDAVATSGDELGVVTISADKETIWGTDVVFFLCS